MTDTAERFHFHTDERTAAAELVRRFHYTRRVPANLQVVGTWHEDGGLWGDAGPAVAACCFSIPPTRWSEPVWELSRLVRRDDVSGIQLSGLVSATVRFIRSRRQGQIDLLVSYADWTQGHHGGIYQAASWNYHGQNAPSVDGAVINATFIPGRMLNSRYGTRSIGALAALGVDARPHWDEGKHLYWKALTRSGRHKATRLGLRTLPYPRPATGETP